MKGLEVLSLLLILSCACGGSRIIAIDSAERKPANSQQNNIANPNNQPLVIGSVEFFASWNGSYIKLERWRDTTDPKVPHPEVFDVICQIENQGNSAVQYGDFIVVTTFDSVVAPSYLHRGDVNKIISEVAWARIGALDDVKMEVVPYLKLKGSTRVRIPGVKLGALIAQFNGEGDTLWPWALRANVRILTRDVVQVATSQAVLPMIPSDNRVMSK